MLSWSDHRSSPKVNYLVTLAALGSQVGGPITRMGIFNLLDIEFFFFTQNKIERSWMLSLLLDGLHDLPDYRVFEKRYIFKLLLSFFNSPMSTSKSQVSGSQHAREIDTMFI